MLSNVQSVQYLYMQRGNFVNASVGDREAVAAQVVFKY